MTALGFGSTLPRLPKPIWQAVALADAMLTEIDLVSVSAVP